MVRTYNRLMCARYAPDNSITTVDEHQNLFQLSSVQNEHLYRGCISTEILLDATHSKIYGDIVRVWLVRSICVCHLLWCWIGFTLFRQQCHRCCHKFWVSGFWDSGLFEIYWSIHCVKYQHTIHFTETLLVNCPDGPVSSGSFGEKIRKAVSPWGLFAWSWT